MDVLLWAQLVGMNFYFLKLEVALILLEKMYPPYIIFLQSLTDFPQTCKAVFPTVKSS